MTIRSHIQAGSLNEAWGHFEAAAEAAPEGTYEQAKQVARLIGTFADDLVNGLRTLGLQANNCDGIRDVEAVIYGYIRDSNPEASVFSTAEGLGESLDGPSRDRVLAQATRDRDLLRDKASGDLRP